MTHSPGPRPGPLPPASGPLLRTAGPLWRTGRRRTALVAVALAAVLASVGPSSAAGQGSATNPRPLRLGDPLRPRLGNPGYDVTAYDIALDSRRADRPLDAVTTIDARATTGLRTLNLDFTQGTVRSVRVDGAPAAFATAGEDLVITPRTRIER